MKPVFQKCFLLALVFIASNSCCYRGKSSGGGFPRKEIRPFPKTNVSVGNIDTLAVYKLNLIYSYNPSTESYSYREKDEKNAFPNTGYLKFYPNNKLGYFVIPKSDTMKLTRAHFNPQNAMMGYYYLEGNNLKIKTSFIGQCELIVLKSQNKIIGDSIIASDKRNGRIYVKQSLPKDFFTNWKPDW